MKIKVLMITFFCASFCGCMFAQSSCQIVKCTKQSSIEKATTFTATMMNDAEKEEDQSTIGCEKKKKASETVQRSWFSLNFIPAANKTSCNPCPIPCPPNCPPICKTVAAKVEVSNDLMVLGENTFEPVTSYLQ